MAIVAETKKETLAFEPPAEDVARPQSSNRSFGLLFAALFGLAALWPLLHHAAIRFWSLGVAAAFLAAALVVPSVLALPNRLWSRLAMVLNRIMTPVMMAVLFFLVVTPLAFAMRLAGKDPLRRKWRRGAESYWVVRTPPGPDPATMRNQF